MHIVIRALVEANSKKEAREKADDFGNFLEEGTISEDIVEIVDVQEVEK